MASTVRKSARGPGWTRVQFPTPPLGVTVIKRLLNDRDSVERITVCAPTQPTERYETMAGKCHVVIRDPWGDAEVVAVYQDADQATARAKLEMKTDSYVHYVVPAPMIYRTKRKV